MATAICERDRAAGQGAEGARVERLRARTVREPPPLLFDLTSLQRTANRRFGFSAARTLELAQALYERHKLLTYPRTDSRHLTSDVVSELPALFEALGAVPEYAAFAAELRGRQVRPNRRIVDDSKVSDHHAIIPTARRALTRGARSRRAAAVRSGGAALPRRVLPRCGVCRQRGVDSRRDGGRGSGARGRGSGASGRRADTRGERADARGGAGEGEGEGAVADADVPILERLPPMPDRYFARGRVRLVAGWQAVAGIDPTGDRRAGDEARRASGGNRRASDGSRGASDEDRRTGDGEPAAALPRLVEGQRLDGVYTSVAKQTTPPPRYTEATLLAAMESAGKSIDDEALRQAMKDCGLGTPATRAAVIETLLKRDYIERTKQHLVPTETGIGLIQALPAPSLASPDLTGQWESRLARIARGEETRAAFHGRHREVRAGHRRRGPHGEPASSGAARRRGRAGGAAASGGTTGGVGTRRRGPERCPHRAVSALRGGRGRARAGLRVQRRLRLPRCRTGSRAGRSARSWPACSSDSGAVRSCAASGRARGARSPRRWCSTSRAR